jgi:hypothetical protein
MGYHLARIYDEWPGEDYEGSSCRGAMKGWFHHGMCSDELWPYRDPSGQVAFVAPSAKWSGDAATRPLGAYYRIDHDAVADLQAAVCEVGAIYASACVHDGWTDPGRSGARTGKSREAQRQPLRIPTIAWSPEVAGDGGHAFAIVGYDEHGFLVQNSWGPSWGFHGFARLLYGDWLAHGMDAWVATLGAPIAGESSPVVLSGSRTVMENAPELQRGLASGATAGAVRAKAKDRAWDLGAAARHALVLTNEGRLAPQLLIEAENADKAAEIVCFKDPERWLRTNAAAKPKIVVYAHGGLNSLAKGLSRTKVLGPCFQDNEIYPIFVCWQSGFLDAVRNILEDVRTHIFGTAGEARPRQAQGFFDDARDRALETFAIPVARPVWQQMKQNATAASAGLGGLVAAADQLTLLRAKHPALEVHLVGHSAGSIVLGPFLDLLAARKVPVGSLSLYAPACTVGFAERHFAPRIGTTVPADKLSIDVLSDDNERKDAVGPYGKSLLYLVSRALECAHKTPLLGLQAIWQPQLDEKDILAGATLKRGPTALAAAAREVPPVVTAWRDAWAKWEASGATLRILAETQVSNGRENVAANHGCFDNWRRCMADTIVRIRGSKLKAALPPLVGF